MHRVAWSVCRSRASCWHCVVANVESETDFALQLSCYFAFLSSRHYTNSSVANVGMMCILSSFLNIDISQCNRLVRVTYLSVMKDLFLFYTVSYLCKCILHNCYFCLM